MASIYATVSWLIISMLFAVYSCTGLDDRGLPMWKRELLHFTWWIGQYRFNNQTHSCSFEVHTVKFSDSESALGLFKADSTAIDMVVSSPDDIRIVFKQEVKYDGSDHFYDDFEFVVEMFPKGNQYIMQGNITKPQANFSSVYFLPEASTGANYMQSSKYSIGLAVGISLFLFVICTVAGILILRWAIKKGYLRHVASSYKFFRNPDTSVSFDNSERGSGPEDVQRQSHRTVDDIEDDYCDCDDQKVHLLIWSMKSDYQWHKNY